MWRMKQLHLVIDGYGGEPESLGSVELIYEFLTDYPDRIGMTRVAPPQVYTYRGQKPGDWGLSGFALIAESHITVHTFPERGYANIDIFSCKAFDAEASLRDVRRMFGLSEVESRVMERGLEYIGGRETYSGMVRERMGLRAAVGSAE